MICTADARQQHKPFLNNIPRRGIIIKMETRQKLDEELKNAMRSGDNMRKQNVRMIMSAIRLAEVEKGGKLDEAGVITIVQKELKSRIEALEDAKKANRPDLVEHAEVEMKFLETFLPKQLSEDELAILVKQAISDTAATGPADMGKVMKALMPRVQGVTTGDQVSKMVRKMLQP
jgi:uncharacterized protein